MEDVGEMVRKKELAAIFKDSVLSHQTRVGRNLSRENQAIELLTSAALFRPSLLKEIRSRIPGVAAVGSIREFRSLEELHLLRHPHLCLPSRFCRLPDTRRSDVGAEPKNV